MDWCEILTSAGIGFVLGIVGNALVDFGMAVLQYKSSAAGQRVEWVKDATNKIVEAKHRAEEDPSKIREIGKLRDKYRYSLGVAIDLLADFRPTTGPDSSFEPCGRQPSFVDKCEDKCEDRWSFFNARVRPVVEDLDSYSFFRQGWLARLYPTARGLQRLLDLCQNLEALVAETDAALEGGHAQFVDRTHIDVPADALSLQAAYCRVYRAWYSWRDWANESRARHAHGTLTASEGKE